MTTDESTDRPSTWPGARSGGLGLLFAALVAAVTFFHFSGGIFCSLQRSSGANIDHALGLAFAGGLAGSLLIFFTRKRRRLCATVSLVAAAVLIVAIALVAVDSATYTAHRSCGFMTTTEETINERVYYLYLLWGIPVALLLRAALSELVPNGPRKMTSSA